MKKWISSRFDLESYLNETVTKRCNQILPEKLFKVMFSFTLKDVDCIIYNWEFDSENEVLSLSPFVPYFMYPRFYTRHTVHVQWPCMSKKYFGGVILSWKCIFQTKKHLYRCLTDEIALITKAIFLLDLKYSTFPWIFNDRKSVWVAW